MGGKVNLNLRMLVLVLASVAVLSYIGYENSAFAMGQAPSTCQNRYDSAITSMIIDNGTYTFDAVSNSGGTFQADVNNGYKVSMTLHTAVQSSNGNQDRGTTWYSDSVNGYGNGHCVYDVGPDEDKISNSVYYWPPSRGPARPQYANYYTFGGPNVSYTVDWFGQWNNHPTQPVDDTAETTKNTPVTIDVLANDVDPDGDKLTVYQVQFPENGNGSAVINSDNTVTYTPNQDFVGTDSFMYYASDGKQDGGWGKVTVDVRGSSQSTTSQLTISSQDNNGNTITGFFTTLSRDGTQIATSFTPASFTLNNGQTYTVHVGGFDKYLFDHWLDVGSTDATRDISISSDTQITAVYKTIPQPPTDLTATVVSSSQIDLSWTAPTDDGGSAITGYMIERSSGDGSTWSIIVDNTGSTDTTYSDTGLSSNTTYTYRVSAINSVGTSDPSDTASATTPRVSTAGVIAGPIPIPVSILHLP